MLAIGLIAMSFTGTPTPKEPFENFGPRYVTECGYSTAGAARSAAMNVPLSPFEIRGEIVVIDEIEGSPSSTFCYVFFVYTIGVNATDK